MDLMTSYPAHDVVNTNVDTCNTAVGCKYVRFKIGFEVCCFRFSVCQVVLVQLDVWRRSLQGRALHAERRRRLLHPHTHCYEHRTVSRCISAAAAASRRKTPLDDNTIRTVGVTSLPSHSSQCIFFTFFTYEEAP